MFEHFFSGSFENEVYLLIFSSFLHLTKIKCISKLSSLSISFLLFDYKFDMVNLTMRCSYVSYSLIHLFHVLDFPWLCLPALVLLSISGFLILLTDLQIANLFGARRYTVMSALVGAYHSGGFMLFLVKVSHVFLYNATHNVL